MGDKRGRCWQMMDGQRTGRIARDMRQRSCLASGLAGLASEMAPCFLVNRFLSQRMSSDNEKREIFVTPLLSD
jgi:hypothetical protein